MRWLLTLLMAANVFAADDLDFEPLRYLAVQRDGRKKPLDTVAVETVQKLTGKRTWTDPVSGRVLPAMDVLVSMWLETRDWSEQPVILVSYKPLKEHLGLPVEERLFSYRQLATPKLQAMLTAAAAKDDAKQDLTREEREARVVSQRLSTLVEAIGIDSFAVVPHPSDPRGAWRPLPASDEKLQALGAAYVRRDPEMFAQAARELRSALRAMGPAVYPAPDSLRREVHYNSFHPFGKAALLYAVAFVAMVATWRWRGGYWVAIAAFVAGIVVHSFAFYQRIMISGRPPITNMYESVVWVSFGAAVFALLLELIYRQRYYVASVAPVSAVMLVLADQFPAVLDPSIGPLVPVLRDNFWLAVHVPTICSGYAAALVAMALGHVTLGLYMLAPQRQELIKTLEHFIYRAMQIGVLLLAAGTILGGIWAHYAWGRFWGWDPKETWALIALLAYLVPLHGRLAGWMSSFALSVASVVSFLAVLMAWYGVNFVLGKGLHSYGFGVGGFTYALLFVAVELLFVAGAWWRRKTVVAMA